jgi:hypothetical protein
MKLFLLLQIFICKLKNLSSLLGMVVHTCNPSYSGGKNQEDRGSKPAYIKQLAIARRQRLIPVLLATQKAEIRRTVV